MSNSRPSAFAAPQSSCSSAGHSDSGRLLCEIPAADEDGGGPAAALLHPPLPGRWCRRVFLVPPRAADGPARVGPPFPAVSFHVSPKASSTFVSSDSLT